MLNIYGKAFGALETNCYIIIDRGDTPGSADGARAIVIDPGHGATAWVDSVLHEEGATLGEILLTHGHLDHTRDAGELARTHSVPVWIHEADEFMLEDRDNLFQGVNQALDRAHMIRPDVVKNYEVACTHPGQNGPSGDNEVVVGARGIVDTCLGAVELIGAPGHSPGSVLIRIDDIVFGGDVLFAGGIGRYDLPRSNAESLMRSLKEAILELPDETTVAPGHGPATTIAQEKQTNPYLRGL